MRPFRSLITRETSARWIASAAVASALGLLGNLVGGRLPGSEPLSTEDVVDAAGVLALGWLGAVLVRRRVAPGLGRALVALAVLSGAVWATGGAADALASGGPPPLVARILDLVSTVLFIPLFALLVLSPLLLFPTGTLPSARWRWAGWAAGLGVSAGMLSIGVAPGPLDDDVPAWGDNPAGIPGLGGVTSGLEVAGLVLLAVAVVTGVAAVATRLLRYRGPRRRQMLWLLAGVVPMVVGLLTDLDDSAVVQVSSAVVIFGSLLGSMGWALLGTPGRTVDTAHSATARVQDSAAAQT
jgi:hypothetical protein